MKFNVRAIYKCLSLTIIFVVLFSPNVLASPTVTKDSVKFVRYNCIDVGINLVLPEDWTYEENFSQEGYYLFFGPEYNQYIEMSVNNIPEDQTWLVSDIASIYYNLSVDNYNYVPLAIPAALQFGDKFGMLCGYVESSSGVYYIMIDVICIFEDKLIMLTIGDEINSFVEKIAQYNVILSSFTSNPSTMGTLEKFFTNMLPADTAINSNLLQGY